jgi:hypothetical protein
MSLALSKPCTKKKYSCSPRPKKLFLTSSSIARKFNPISFSLITIENKQYLSKKKKTIDFDDLHIKLSYAVLFFVKKALFYDFLFLPGDKKSSGSSRALSDTRQLAV